jgi:hypothetical protein
MNQKNYINTRVFYKAIHPKVLNVLSMMNDPSPVRVVRDLHQPSSGYLKDLPRASFGNFASKKEEKTEKTAVSLDLNMSRLKIRRMTSKCN